jgi:hypothetical protein
MRAFLETAAADGLHVRYLDVRTAFLHGELEEVWRSRRVLRRTLCMEASLSRIPASRKDPHLIVNWMVTITRSYLTAISLT